MTTARNKRATRANTPGRKYVSPEGLAEMLDIPLRTIRRWRVDDYGPRPIKVGRLLRYSLAEVDAFLADPEGYQHKRDMEIHL